MSTAWLMRLLELEGHFTKTALDAIAGAAIVAWLSMQPWLLELGDHVDGSGDGLPSSEETTNLIKQRRSIFLKDFNGEQVPENKVEAILEAANWAPTHGKTEPWRFVVLSGSGREQMTALTIEHVRTSPMLSEEQRGKKLAKLAKKQVHWVKASYMIAIVMKRYPVEGKENPEWEEMCACACAVQNMYLMATSLKVAAYWSSWDAGSRDCPEMRELLKMDHPEDKCLGFFMVGSAHPEVVAGYRAKRGDIAEKVTWIGAPARPPDSTRSGLGSI